MLSDLIKELQNALDANGDAPVDFVAVASVAQRRVLRHTAVFLQEDLPEPRFQITLQ